MIPKKAKDFIPTQAEKEGIPEPQMEAIILAYYKKLRDDLTDLKHIRMEFLGMGYMKIRIRYLQRQIEKIKNDPDMEEWKRRKELEPLLKLDKIKSDEWEKAALIAEMKNEFKRNRKSKEKDDGTEG